MPRGTEHEPHNQLGLSCQTLDAFPELNNHCGCGAILELELERDHGMCVNCMPTAPASRLGLEG